MNIGGLQKTTLIDFPGKLASTIFTKGCNLRCSYCHNADLVLGNNLTRDFSEEEIFNFLEKRKNILDAVCISGGEPLMQEKILEFLYQVKKMGYLIKVDTNGFYPIKLKELIKSELVDYLAMDVKHSAENYEKAVGIKDIDLNKINESIEILQTNQIPFEFRTTAVKGIHTERDFIKIGNWLKGPYQFFLQNYENSGDILASRLNSKHSLKSFTKKELESFLALLIKDLPKAQIRYV